MPEKRVEEGEIISLLSETLGSMRAPGMLKIDADTNLQECLDETEYAEVAYSIKEQYGIEINETDLRKIMTPKALASCLNALYKQLITSQ